jgi:pre-mRNA-processing factor 17
MADFDQYAPNMAPKDALIVREEAEPAHAMDMYSGDSLARAALGPANPFSVPLNNPLKRKNNVPTGTASETFVSEHAFRSKYRGVERRGGPTREYQSGTQIKQANAQARSAREGKGDATVVEGANSYVGPWAKYKKKEFDDVGDDEDLASDEEYEIVEEEDEDGEDEDEVIQSGTVVQAPAESLVRRKKVAQLGEETTVLHASEEFDYQGRTYMHVPQDLDVDLRKEAGSITNYVPKRQIHAWKNHTKAITALRLFPRSSHLLLSGSADTTIKIWDVYHQRELLRSYSGHNKALSDLCFNHDGTKFISASWDRMMKLWDTETGKCLTKFTTGKTPHVAKFNNDSVENVNQFLAGLSSGEIVQFDTRADHEIVQNYNHHLAAVNTIEFIEEGSRFLSTSDDKSVRAWDWTIPVPVKYIMPEVDSYPLVRSCLHPSGKYAVYQSSNNEAVVYSTGEKIRQNRKKFFKGHHTAGTAIDVAVSPDGQFLASGDSAGYLVVWDWKKCNMLHKLQCGSEALTSVQWSQQETSKVFTGSQDGQIRLLD